MSSYMTMVTCLLIIQVHQKKKEKKKKNQIKKNR